MNNVLYYLKDDPHSRYVVLDESGIIRIMGLSDSTAYKQEYDAYIFEKNDSNVTKLARYIFHKMIGLSYTIATNRILRPLLFFVSPTPRISKYGNILDIGCSTGNFLHSLNKHWNKYGIEINKNASEIAKSKDIELFEERFENYYCDVNFRIIRGNHVIEHFEDYNMFFKKLKSILPEQSKAIMYTPNYNSISRILFRSRWDGYTDPTHFIIYDLSSISTIANKHGLKVTNSTTYYMGISAASVAQFFFPKSPKFKAVLYWTFFLILLPLSLVEKLFGKGEALYVELENL